EHLEREPRVGGALGDPDRGLMEHDVDAGHERPDQLPVLDISADRADLPGPERGSQVLLPTANEVVEYPDLVGACGRKLIDDRRPDGAGRARHEEAATGDHAATPFRDIRAPPLSTLRDAASSSLSTRRPAQASVRGGRPSLIAALNSAMTDMSASRSGSAGMRVSPVRYETRAWRRSSSGTEPARSVSTPRS